MSKNSDNVLMLLIIMIGMFFIIHNPKTIKIISEYFKIVIEF